MNVCTYVCMQAYIYLVSIHPYLPTIPTYRPNVLTTYRPADQPTDLPAYLHTGMHAQAHASVHTHVAYSGVRLKRWYLLPGAPELFGMQFEDLRAAVLENRVC